MVLQFRCRLLENLLLTSQVPQNGIYQTLNFIPGRCFRGIVASEGGTAAVKCQDVHFSDAHPAYIIENNGDQCYWRTLHIPASMMHPKHRTVGELCYLWHAYDRKKDHKGLGGRSRQMKQCRHGYYAFIDGIAYPVVTLHTYDQKAMVKRQRPFGYDSLRSGALFLFEVDVPNEDMADIVRRCIVGIKRIGRSRSAQYGLVDIQEQPFENSVSTETLFSSSEGDVVLVYADSRLVFTNPDNGQCTYTPTAAQLNIPNGEIDWKLTQTRTFCYTPWNSQRHAPESDISGFEKGSVIAVRVKEGWTEPVSRYVGNYNQDGFGRVIYNPDFLMSEESESSNGKAQYGITEVIAVERPPKGSNNSSKLIKYIKLMQKREKENNLIYRKVNEFSKDLDEFSSGERKNNNITSQNWLSIRNFVIGFEHVTDLEERISYYFKHMAIQERWYGKRKGLIEEYINFFKNNMFHRHLMRKALYVLSTELYFKSMMEEANLRQINTKQSSEKPENI